MHIDLTKEKDEETKIEEKKEKKGGKRAKKETINKESLQSNSEINFINPFDDVRIEGKIITFTKDLEFRTVFIDRIVDSKIMKMFVSFLLYILYILFY
jgi:hypothetical protein